MIINGIVFVTQSASTILCRTIMKVSIIIFSQVWLLLAICSSCSHDNNDIPISKNCEELKAQGIIDSFPYPVRPGSEAWENRTTSIIETVSVPEEILEEMCTYGLVYTCVYCPMFLNMLAFNSPRDGFLWLCKINSFHELTKREYAGIELFDYYTKLTDTTLNNITFAKYYLQIYLVELFFSQQEFLSQFNNESLNEVLLKAYDNLLIKEKLGIDRTMYVANLYLTANILYFNIKYQPLIDFIDNYETFDIFYTFYIWNEEVIDSLRFYTEEYVKENLK